MVRTRLPAGRMPREPVVPKPIHVIKSPPSTANVVETTPTFPSQSPSSRPSNPDSSPSATNVVEPTPTFPSQSPSSCPSNPDTINKANKPHPKPQPVFHRSSTRSLNKVGTPDNPLTVDDPSSSDEPVDDPSSSDEPGSQEVVSVENNSDSSELNSPESLQEHSSQTHEKQHKPPVVQSPVTDQRKSSRRRAAPPDLVFPAPKGTKAQVALRAYSLPPAAHNRISGPNKCGESNTGRITRSMSNRDALCAIRAPNKSQPHVSPFSAQPPHFFTPPSPRGPIEQFYWDYYRSQFSQLDSLNEIRKSLLSIRSLQLMSLRDRPAPSDYHHISPTPFTPPFSLR